MDHPDTITHLACLDIVPTLDTWNVLNGVTAAVAFHLFLMAQPPTLPETLIANSAPESFAHFLDAWATDQAAIPADILAGYLRASSAAVPSIAADFRASAGIDLEHDQSARSAGDQRKMPVTVIQQDWGTHLSYDAEAVWRVGPQPDPPQGEFRPLHGRVHPQRHNHVPAHPPVQLTHPRQ